MSSWRRENVWRHIDNPRIHNGRGIPIPYIANLAGLHRGLYRHPTSYQYLRRNRNVKERSPIVAESTVFDKVRERLADKTVEKLADNIVRIAFAPNRNPSPIQHLNRHLAPEQHLLFSMENVFGFGGYVCRYCMTVNAIIFGFSLQPAGVASNYFQVTCLNHDGDPIDSITYNRLLLEEGFVEPLKDRIQNTWSRIPIFRIVAYPVTDPRILDRSGNIIAHHKYRLKLSRYEDGNAERTRTNIIYLSYDDTL